MILWTIVVGALIATGQAWADTTDTGQMIAGGTVTVQGNAFSVGSVAYDFDPVRRREAFLW